MKASSCKGQVASTDAMMGLSGLMLVLIIVLAMFGFLYGKAALVSNQNGMEMKAYFAMEQLMSPGVPAHWQTLGEAGTESYGLESQMGVLNEAKILALNSSFASNRSLAAEKLGIPGYDFSVYVMDYYTRGVIYYMGEVNSTEVLSIGRISTLGDSLVIVQLKVAK